MKLFLLYRARLLGALRSPPALIFIILAVVVSSAAALIARDKAASELTVAVVSEDKGESGERLILFLRDTDSFSMTRLPREQALLRLRQDRLEAVIIIPPDFSDKIGRAEFRNTLEHYVSPSSQAAATVSEPLLNAVMMFWVREYAIDRTDAFLIEHDREYTDADERLQRGGMDAVWESGALIRLQSIVTDAGETAAPDSGPYGFFVRWYAVLCLFYLIVSATWVLDAGKRSLRARIEQTGVSRWKVMFATGAAPLTLCAAGYFIGGAVCATLIGATFFDVMTAAIPVLPYLLGLMGITVLTASLAENTMQLMFLAPLLTLFNGMLSGLFAPLPGWAYVLELLSRGLPGRWLALSLAAPLSSLFPSALCAAAWLAAGAAFSAVSGKGRRNRGSL